ncbi:hypothetical protein GW796_10765 [archaeon]|nr:hypothetical protein [archaeon]NCQ52343.1 hypothetical protein [archaeon]
MKKSIKSPAILAIIPRGDTNNFSVFYADSFYVLLGNGKLKGMDDGFIPDVSMVKEMQENIDIALAKIDTYVKELNTAKELEKYV